MSDCGLNFEFWPLHGKTELKAFFGTSSNSRGQVSAVCLSIPADGSASLVLLSSAALYSVIVYEL